ncbi:DUF4355 domain-containing protein [Vagococcus vulneris]|uniref:Phage capsid protein n=1 Tax=Vagococcus vulneris TaxID=1977869 RepID=A0A429ZWS6_9ENTE|nr:DUF4355 domain-containing protein [Vagococcus vulneris]RST98266.1 hypothetical protein CBF37_08105 [Vagococcus vulneris]
MKNKLFKMNLQLFSADTGSDGGDNPETTTEEEAVETPKIDIENLSDEQVAELKAKFNFKTDDDVDKIIKSKHSRWQKEKEEAEKLAKMNAEEKRQYELESIKRQLEEERRKNSLNSMSKEASKMLSEQSINADDEVLAFVVRDTAEDTKQAVEAFSSLLQRKVEEGVKIALSGKAPKLNLTPGSHKEVTKEEIMAIKDTTKRQKLIEENIHLFK